MNDTYRKIKEASRIDNYLAGTTHSPIKQASNTEAQQAYQGAIPANTAQPNNGQRR